MILFNEEKHSYTFNDQEFVSVTKIIKALEQPKDWDEIAEKYGKKHNLTKEEVLLAWKTKGDLAAQKGTNYHKLREDELIEKGAYPILDTPQGKQAYDLKNLKPGTYPELILYMLSHRICGTSDRIEINEDRTFHVYDLKTNAKLKSSGDMEAYWNPKKKIKEKERLVSPVSHLYNCEIDKYTLQLSCYAYMLEQYDFECTGLTIEHILFNEDDTYKESNIIPIPYLRDEAKNVINWYYKNNIR